MTVPPGDLIADTLHLVHESLARRGIWHSLAYGTLLGAVRDGDLIPWDDDFDLLVRPADLPAIHEAGAELASHGIRFQATRLDARGSLALNLQGTERFLTGATGVFRDGAKLGDLFAFHLFSDGVLRRYDFATETYWCPHSSFPHFFAESTGSARIRDRIYPTIGHAERWLEGVYGADWRQPYRCARQGGEARAGSTTHGDRYDPKLAAEIAWCEGQGWDRARYAHERAWPRDVAGAGPRGPTERTADSSGSLWWRDRAELVDHF